MTAGVSEEIVREGQIILFIVFKNLILNLTVFNNESGSNKTQQIN